MAGIDSERARIAVCDSGPPNSVMKATTFCWLSRMMSAGVMSSLTITVGSAMSNLGAPSTAAAGCACLRSTRRMRSTTCCTSSLRVFRYGSSICSKTATSPSRLRFSAASALSFLVRMLATVVSTMERSSIINRCVSMKAAMSPGVPTGICSRTCRSSSRARRCAP